MKELEMWRKRLDGLVDSKLIKACDVSSVGRTTDQRKYGSSSRVILIKFKVSERNDIGEIIEKILSEGGSSPLFKGDQILFWDKREAAIRENQRIITIDGEKYTVQQAAISLNETENAIYSRLRNGKNPLKRHRITKKYKEINGL